MQGIYERSHDEVAVDYHQGWVVLSAWSLSARESEVGDMGNGYEYGYGWGQDCSRMRVGVRLG